MPMLSATLTSRAKLVNMLVSPEPVSGTGGDGPLDEDTSAGRRMREA